MSTWHYEAVAVAGPQRGARKRGEINGTAAAEVRASLRRVGWQVLDLRPSEAVEKGESPVSASWQGHLRARRRTARAEICDSLATMLESGVPVVAAVNTLVGADRARRSAARAMLASVRGDLQDGRSLAAAMARHPSWYDATEVAMVEAGQHAGELPRVLRTLAERNERASELGQKLIGALAYPALIAMVGTGVVVFLSTSTLPDLARILTDAGIEVPALSRRVMAVGGFIAGNWALLAVAAAALVAAAIVAPALLDRHQVQAPRWLGRLTPRLARRMALSQLCLRVAELIETGIPVGDALRVVAPTLGSRTMRARVREAAGRIDRGDDLAAALDAPDYFDREFRQLLDVGQASGELPAVLRRLGERYARAARRLIERLAAVLEPAVILALAVLVGIVVMAAVLPLLRLQEVL